MASIKKRTWVSGGREKTAWVVHYRDQNKQAHIKTLRTKHEAEAWRTETMHEISRGIHTPPSKSLTVKEAGVRWLEQCEADGLERATVRQYRQHLVLHIAPLIGAIKLAELSVASVKDFRNQLLKHGRPAIESEQKQLRIERVPVSRIMAGKVVVSLGALLGNAMEAGLIARNVVREQSKGHSTRQRRIEKRHEKNLEVGVDVPTKEELRAILVAADGMSLRWRTFLYTLVFSGLRASEMRGLRWSDIDFEKSLVTVRQRADRYNEIGSPKSESGKRAVPVPAEVINLLKEWRVGSRRWPLDLVFPNGNGEVEALLNLTRSGLGVVQKKAGITKERLHPKYGMHAFRHAAASLFIAQKMSPKEIQVLMGHSTIGVTYNTYGHLFPSEGEGQATAQRIAAELLG
jgi:integrase